MAMHPPSTLARKNPCHAWESIDFANVVACHLPEGVPLRWHLFSPRAPSSVLPCKPPAQDDIFSTSARSANKLPSHTINLVGRQLMPGKTCSPHLFDSIRALVYCCVPCWLISHELYPPKASVQKSPKQAAASTAPPISIPTCWSTAWGPDCRS